MSHELENYIKELKQVFYLNSTMQKYTDLKQLLQLMLKESIKLTKATSGSILFRHKQSERLFFYVTEGVEHELVKNTHLNVGDGIAGTVIADGVPKIVNNTSLDPKFIVMNAGVLSEMAVPIIVNQQILGVIVLDQTAKDSFTEKHLELAQMICGHAGFIISYFIQTFTSQKNTRLFENIINITSSLSAEEIFKLLTRELNATNTCIINKKGEVIFSDGDSVAPIDVKPELFEKSHYFILEKSNEYHVPYTRMVIPRIQKDMTFIADKIYYFSDNVQVDIDFADKILEFLSAKDSKFHNDETLTQWVERKMNAPEGQVYDVIIGSVEKEIIIASLKKFKYNRLKTSQFLGINRNTLRHKMEMFGLEK